MRHCLMYTWEHTDLFCGGSHGIPINERLRVDQHYGRVDRAVNRLFCFRRENSQILLIIALLMLKGEEEELYEHVDIELILLLSYSPPTLLVKFCYRN